MTTSDYERGFNAAKEMAARTVPKRLTRVRKCIRVLQMPEELREPQPVVLELKQPDEMIAWLTDLNSNWAVCRNTRSFKEGQPSEYWTKFDKAMGEAFELQIALMKLHSAAPRTPAPSHPAPARRRRPPCTA